MSDEEKKIISKQAGKLSVNTKFPLVQVCLCTLPRFDVHTCVSKGASMYIY